MFSSTIKLFGFETTVHIDIDLFRNFVVDNHVESVLKLATSSTVWGGSKAQSEVCHCHIANNAVGYAEVVGVIVGVFLVACNRLFI